MGPFYIYIAQTRCVKIFYQDSDFLCSTATCATFQFKQHMGVVWG